jgi:alkylation response protein AidB-like acyl-CoA dehydrogenase
MSDTQLRDSWRQIARQRIAPLLASHATNGVLSRAGVRQAALILGEAGLQGAHVPADQGGQGLRGRDLGEMLQALAPVLGFTAFQVVARSVSGSATEATRSALLPGLISGEIVGCAAISEPEIGSDAGSISCRAERRGDRYILNGTKTWVLGGSAADIANTMVVTDPAAGSRGISRMLVDMRQPGVRVEDIPMTGATAIPMNTVHFSDAEAPVEYLLGEEGRGLGLTLRGLEASRAAVASQAAGLARAAVEAAIERAGARSQFGKPIASYQLVQSIIARAWADADAAELMARRAWDAIDAGEHSTRTASAAKFFCVEAALRATQQCMEVFGASALRDDFPVKRLHGYATALAAPDGTLQVNQLILARELLGVSAFV